MEAPTQYEANGQRIRNEITMDWQEKPFCWVLNDVKYMQFDSVGVLGAELI